MLSFFFPPSPDSLDARGIAEYLASVADFRQVVNVQTFAAFTDAGARIDFGFESTSQAAINQSNTTQVEVSFDGQNVHKVLRPNEPDEGVSWDRHKRNRVFLRRVGADPGAPVNVEVLAHTE